jgi:REP element-mobilizing transposase RayT
MQLNGLGRTVDRCWHDLPNHYQNVRLDAFIIMPDHVHGIIRLVNDERPNHVGAGLKPAPTWKRHGLSEIVRALKTFSSRRINQLRNISNKPVWQRNYWERIIRDSEELDYYRTYVRENPKHWNRDRIHS